MTQVCARALVVVAHGEALALVCEVDQRIDSLGDYGLREDGFTFGDEIDCNLADGLWVVELGWEDRGASDWDDRIRDVGIAVYSYRLASAEEWHDHLAGNWPWEKASEWSVEPKELNIIEEMCREDRDLYLREQMLRAWGESPAED